MQLTKNFHPVFDKRKKVLRLTAYDYENLVYRKTSTIYDVNQLQTLHKIVTSRILQQQQQQPFYFARYIEYVTAKKKYSE